MQELLCREIGPFGPMKWTCMIHCFFDDSGKESDSTNRIVCIAGYLAAGDAFGAC